MAQESYKTETTDSSTEWILSMKFWKRKKSAMLILTREKKTEIEIYFITAETAVILLLRDWRH